MFEGMKQRIDDDGGLDGVVKDIVKSFLWTICIAFVVFCIIFILVEIF